MKIQFKKNFLMYFSVNRLSSIEVQSCEGSSPYAKLSLKLKTLEDKEQEKEINIPKEKLNELLTGTVIINF